MKDEVIIAIISGIVSLCVSWLFFKYQNYKNNKIKKKTLKINFAILIKDIQDLLWYLEDIIKDRGILEKHYIQELDYNKILIDYNNLIKDRKVIINLLEFYNLRTKIKKYFLEEKIEIPDYLDKEMGVYKKNIWAEQSHIIFIKN